MALWKLRVGVEDYYLAQVASGLDEYYTGAGEAPGSWMGGGVAGLALTGEVTPADLRAILAGLAPNTGLTPNGTTLTAHPWRVPGFDLTFSVPKSVSVLFALGDPLVQHAVVQGCEAALVEALGWLEREACFVRRGTNKAENKAAWGEQWGTRRMVANGFVAASFRHRTSRAGDPHLHWHVLVANLAQGIDGRWSALDGTALYSAKRTAGVMFQVAMRRELTARVGVEWGPMHKDSADIAGIPARVLREFSRRSAQIAEWLEAAGRSGPAATDEAILATRAGKQIPGDWAVVEAEWRTRAEALGWGPTALDQLLSNVRPVAAQGPRYVVEEVVWRGGESTVVSRVVEFEEWLEWLLETRVTANEGTFTRFDLTQTVAAALPSPASTAVVEATVQLALASAAVVPVGDQWAERPVVYSECRVVPDDRRLRYSSRALLAVERQLLDHLATGADASSGVLERSLVEAAIAGSTLGDDQSVAVRRLTSSGDRVAVMVGRAGAGKTHTLGTLRGVYEASGYTVIGLAPSAQAARELGTGSGIGSTTIARHLVERREIDASTVVVVDEAGMAGVRDIAAVVDQVTRVGARLVLVGDHHQLPEVSAGGAFRAALDTLGDRVVELTVNRRQQHAWEQAALDQLRHGDVTTAFAAYLVHGRVVLTDNPDRLHHLAICDWQRLRTSGDTLMLAGTRAEARLLNRLARQLLADTGELDVDREFEIAGRAFAPGDRVVLCRNHRGQHLANGEPFTVDNGMLATVTDFDEQGVQVVLSTGEHVVLERSYVERGWVDHAYALTIHKAQGVTCDHVLMVGPAGLYREGIYVALSRARLSAWIYATTAQVGELDQRHDAGIPLPTEAQHDPEHDLLARMHTSGAKTLVTVGDGLADRVGELAAAVPARELIQRAKAARDAEQAVDVFDPAGLCDAYTRTVAARTHLEDGRRVRALDRDNVGHVLAIDDTAGTCVVHFENDHGRNTTRTMRWHQLVVIDHPDTVTLTPIAAATLAAMADDVAEAELDWAIGLSAYGVEPGDADLYRRAVHVAVDRAAHQLRAETPDWLTTWIGTRPCDAPGAAVWDDTASRIAQRRLLHGVGDDQPGLGLRPVEPSAAERWQQLMIRILEDRCWLADRHNNIPVETLAVRTPVELVERRAELEQLVATAPPDQHHLIEQVTASEIEPIELHRRLLDATRVQDARRDWILANWPHVVELQQINTLIATQPPLAHWPRSEPEAVREVLDTLRQIAPTLERREERSLAELDQLAIDNDPVLKLETALRRLDALAARAVHDPERQAVDREIVTTARALRDARRERTVDNVFAKYMPDAAETAREHRAITLAHDTLSDPPAWVTDHVRHLHDTGQLATTRLDQLVTRIVIAAAHLDQHGHLPPGWPTLQLPAVEQVVPDIEISLPTL